MDRGTDAFLHVLMKESLVARSRDCTADCIGVVGVGCHRAARATVGRRLIRQHDPMQGTRNIEPGTPVDPFDPLPQQARKPRIRHGTKQR